MKKDKSNHTVPVICVRYLALGDSYTKGESVSGQESFPSQLAVLLNANPELEVTETRIVAQTGWTTKDLKDAIVAESFDHSYDMVTLLIGVNNQYRGGAVSVYADEFKILLAKAVELAGNDKQKVTVISIPDYGYTPFGQADRQRISMEIDLFNAANKEITEAMGIAYVDITSISRSSTPGLVAGDGLHPSGKQYGLWVNAMIGSIRSRVLQQP